MAITERYFDTVAGSRTLSHPVLGGKHIYWVRRQGLTYKEVSPLATVANLEFKHLGISISFQNPFENEPPRDTDPVGLIRPEKIYVLYG